MYGPGSKAQCRRRPERACRADLDLRLRQREYRKVLSRMRFSQTPAPRSLDLYLRGRCEHGEILL